jgi:hypothetical protein
MSYAIAYNHHTKQFSTRIGKCLISAANANDLVDFHNNNNNNNENAIEEAKLFVQEDRLEVLYHELTDLILDIKQKQKQSKGGN